MKTKLILVPAFLSIGTALLMAAAPEEAVVQGLYEGGCKSCKIEARVVAQSAGAYKVLIRQELGEGKIGHVELEGKTEGDAVSFSGKAGEVEWKATYAAGVISGSCGEGCKLELKRVERLSPTMGKQPPAGAIVLLGGKSLDEMVRVKDQPWDPAMTSFADDGSIQVPKGGMNSKRAFEGDCDLHVEFMCPLVSKAHSQGRGNSGVFMPNGSEIQVLDSFGEVTYLGGGCGGLYRYKDPDAMDDIESLKEKPDHKYTLASAPPLQWQTYDVQYRVQRQDGKVVGKPHVTVLHNGIKIHDNAELNKDAKKGPFHFQDHNNPVRYRNIWVLPIDSK